VCCRAAPGEVFGVYLPGFGFPLAEGAVDVVEGGLDGAAVVVAVGGPESSDLAVQEAGAAFKLLHGGCVALKNGGGQLGGLQVCESGGEVLSCLVFELADFGFAAEQVLRALVPEGVGAGAAGEVLDGGEYSTGAGLGFVLGGGVALGLVQGFVEVLEGVAEVGDLDGGGDAYGPGEGLGGGGLGRQGDHGGEGQQQEAGNELLQEATTQAGQQLGALAPGGAAVAVLQVREAAGHRCFLFCWPGVLAPVYARLCSGSSGGPLVWRR